MKNISVKNLRLIIGNFIIAFILLLSMTLSAFAHSGRTDSNGGHNKTSDGTYHYHSGNDRTIEYSTPQNDTQAQTQPVMQVPTEPATQPPTQPPTQPTTEAPKNSISKYYDEFPIVPNIGYIANIEPINITNKDGIYVYQYDVKKITDEHALEFLNALKTAGFVNMTQIDDAHFSFDNGQILILSGETDTVFSLTVGALPNTEKTKTNEISVLVDGEKINFDQQPENINGRIMVPIRFVVEKMGCTVEWDGDTQTVYINTSDCPLIKKAVKTDNINVYVNNEIVVFEDQQPVNKNGRVLIPVRFVAEKLGYTVEWNNDNQTVLITKDISTIVYDVRDTFFGASIEEVKRTEKNPLFYEDEDTLTYSGVDFHDYKVDILYTFDSNKKLLDCMYRFTANNISITDYKKIKNILIDIYGNPPINDKTTDYKNFSTAWKNNNTMIALMLIEKNQHYELVIRYVPIDS